MSFSIPMTAKAQIILFLGISANAEIFKPYGGSHKLAQQDGLFIAMFFFRLSFFSCHGWVSRASLLFMSRQKKFSINLIEMKFQNLLRGNLTRRDIKAGLPETRQAWQKIRIPVRRNPLQASSQWCSHSMKWLILCHSGTGDHPNGQIAADWNASDVWMFYLCWRHQPWRTL